MRSLYTPSSSRQDCQLPSRKTPCRWSENGVNCAATGDAVTVRRRQKKTACAHRAQLCRLRRSARAELLPGVRRIFPRLPVSAQTRPARRLLQKRSLQTPDLLIMSNKFWAEEVPVIVLAFPRFERDRAVLRRMMPGRPLPAIYPRSIDLPCHDCGVTLAVGPRCAEQLGRDASVIACCPVCSLIRSRGRGYCTISMDNPDARFE